MLHTIKTPDKHFNLLFLDYSELIVHSCKCLSFNPEKRKMEQSTLHMNTRSFIIVPDDIEESVKKFSYSDNFTMKLFSIEEILASFQTIEKESNKKTYQNTTKKRMTNSQGNNLNNLLFNSTSEKKISLNNIASSIPICAFDFKLSNLGEWLNKYVFETDFKSSNEQGFRQGYGNNAINNQSNQLNNNINAIFNSKSIDLGLKKKDADSDINIKELFGILKHYRSSYFLSLMSGIAEAFPLLNMNNNLNSIGLNNISNLNTLIQLGHSNTITSSNTVENQPSSNLQTTTSNILINNKGKNIKEQSTFNNNNINNTNNQNKDNNNYLSTSSSTYKYFFCLFRANKCTKITRSPYIAYNPNNNPPLQILILMLPLNELSKFIEDKILIENFYNTPSDNLEILKNTANKKICDTIESLSLPKDLLNTQSLESNKGNFKVICKATRILPEGNQIGVFTITKSNYVEYYASINNYKQRSPAKRFGLHEIKVFLVYRYLFKNKALHIFIYKHQRNVIFDFETEADMEVVKGIFEKECSNVDKYYTNVDHHTQLWVNGYMSNYDYLLYLNFIGSRSFLETSQYPVFPWIIKNYNDYDFKTQTDIDDFVFSKFDENYRDLSKPIGAINKDKLEKLKKHDPDNIENEKNERKFIYQNHYSTPFVLSYYFMRAFPHFSLRLNSGKHDKSDRVFYSIKECWDILLSSDKNQVFELTPE